MPLSLSSWGDDRWADYKHVERHRVVNGNHAVWECTGEGTWAATGKHVEFPMVMSLEFDDAGKVVSLGFIWTLPGLPGRHDRCLSACEATGSGEAIIPADLPCLSVA
jgi:hypothetical protein